METPADIQLLTRYNVDRFTVTFPQKMNQVLTAMSQAINTINQSPSPKVRKERDILTDETGTDDRMEIEMHNIFCTIYNLCEQTEHTISQFINQALTQVSLLQLKRAELIDKTVMHLKEGKARFKTPDEPVTRTLLTFVEGFENAEKDKKKKKEKAEVEEEEHLEEECSELPKKKKEKQSLHMRRTDRPRPGPKLKMGTQAEIESQGQS